MVALAALAIGALLVVPIWRIDLAAPQYPEGLVLQIFHDSFTGDVDKINGFIGLIVGWGLIIALIGRRGGLFAWLMVLGAFVLWAMWDMYSWGYKYGHDLDPRAAIKVEGMAYQPPLLGHKKLLNFDAWSLPDTGGWILFASISIAVLVWFIEWKWPRKTGPVAPESGTATMATGTMLPVLALLALGLSTSCTHGVHPHRFRQSRMRLLPHERGGPAIRFSHRDQEGTDLCVRLAGVHGATCGGGFHRRGRSGLVVGVRPRASGHMIDATKAHYLSSPELRSPMNGNAAAFALGGRPHCSSSQLPGRNARLVSRAQALGHALNDAARDRFPPVLHLGNGDDRAHPYRTSR
ncbi:MAG: hypothetical protein IPH53_17650 [Flavobacteriales bacterium]|nr:hypothetical protein [Flavobacteriales bacterium]